MLDNKTFKRYGCETEITANVRLIFGTNQDLRELGSNGTFMHDFL
ncbi:MAG: sigma 54-interacting transcriptional regulator [Ignavibacteria bacterium]|nr:sigma 54-interacting transcriptional regulator [Ignavibacteria bacterium]